MPSPKPLIFAAAMTAATLAGAQPPAPVPAAGGGAATPGGDDWQARMAARRQEQQADLTTVLRLRPDQQPALAAWLDATAPRPPADGAEPQGGGRHRRDAPPPPSEGAADPRAAATERFRAVLDPAQQPVFDALERLRRRPGGHWRGAPGGPDLPPPPGA